MFAIFRVLTTNVREDLLLFLCASPLRKCSFANMLQMVCVSADLSNRTAKNIQFLWCSVVAVLLGYREIMKYLTTLEF